MRIPQLHINVEFISYRQFLVNKILYNFLYESLYNIDGILRSIEAHFLCPFLHTFSPLRIHNYCFFFFFFIIYFFPINLHKKSIKNYHIGSEKKTQLLSK